MQVKNQNVNAIKNKNSKLSGCAGHPHSIFMHGIPAFWYISEMHELMIISSGHDIFGHRNYVRLFKYYYYFRVSVFFIFWISKLHSVFFLHFWENVLNFFTCKFAGIQENLEAWKNYSENEYWLESFSFNCI